MLIEASSFTIKGDLIGKSEHETTKPIDLIVEESYVEEEVKEKVIE